MHTGKINPIELLEDEQNDKLSTQLISDNLVHTQNKLIFPALNTSNNFVLSTMKLLFIL